MPAGARPPGGSWSRHGQWRDEGINSCQAFVLEVAGLLLRCTGAGGRLSGWGSSDPTALHPQGGSCDSGAEAKLIFPELISPWVVSA